LATAGPALWAGGIDCSSKLQDGWRLDVTIADAANPAVSASTSVVSVSPAAATRLAFATPPRATTIGSVLAPIAIEILDEFGNVVTSDNTDRVTVASRLAPAASPLAAPPP